MLFVKDETFNISNVPDYFPANTCHDITPEEENNNDIKNFRAAKDYHEDEEDEDFYFLGQHLNTPGLLDDDYEYPDYYDSNFEIANRAFYATINKFTRQGCPESRRKTPYSFLENWHLHSIYSKSQQTLLGITPVRPSVLLSGDDFMFTPPFVPPESDQLEFDWEESDDSEFYSLSPCPESNQLGQLVPLSSCYDMQSSGVLSASSSPPPTPPQSHPSTATAPFISEKEDKINYYNSFNESSILQENNWIENQRRPHSLNGFDVNETNNTNHNLLSENVHHISLQDTNDDNIIDMSEDIYTSYMSNDQHFVNSSSSSSSSSSEGEDYVEEEEEEEYDDDDYLEYSDQVVDDEDEDDDDYKNNRAEELSTFNFEHLYEQIDNEIISKEPEEALMIRSSSFLSHKSAEMPRMTPSVMSYQSLADILSSPPSSPPLLSSSPSNSLSASPSTPPHPKAKSYGAIERKSNDRNRLVPEPTNYYQNQGVIQVVRSTMSAIFDLADSYANNYDEEMAITSVQSTHTASPESGSTNSFWAYTFVYVMYIWQLLVLCSESVIVNIRKHIIPHRQ